MTGLLAVMIAQTLDPIRMILVGLVMWPSYKLISNKLVRWLVIAAGVLVIALLIAAMLNRPTVIPGFLAGMIIAGIIALIVRAVVSRRSAAS